MDWSGRIGWRWACWGGRGGFRIWHMEGSGLQWVAPRCCARRQHKVPREAKPRDALKGEKKAL